MVDTGETAYAMVLAEDLDGDGQLELLLSTMGGNLFAFGVPAPADPLAVWPSQVQLRTVPEFPCCAEFSRGCRIPWPFGSLAITGMLRFE